MTVYRLNIYTKTFQISATTAIALLNRYSRALEDYGIYIPEKIIQLIMHYDILAQISVIWEF